MNASIRQLKAFVVVAQTRSFAQACGLLHLSQPALSIAIRNLEQAVGGTLFVRTTRSIALSPEGEAFLPLAQRLLRDWDSAFGDLRELFGRQRGDAHVGGHVVARVHLHAGDPQDVPGRAARHAERSFATVPAARVHPQACLEHAISDRSS